jgi:hypothetical protein
MPARRRREMMTNKPTMRSVGPNPSRSCCHSGVVASGLLALITTPLPASSASSLSLLTNVGSCVLNLIAAVPFVPAGGAVTFLKSPWIVFPVDVMSATLPAFTCCSKYVYEIPSRLGAFEN